MILVHTTKNNRKYGCLHMKNTLELRIFLEFSLKSSKGMIDSESAKSHQLLKLIVYILMNRERDISHQELIDILWQDKHTDNPAGALKNLVYRLRNLLKCVGDEEYIIARRGFYRWNTLIQVDTDYEQFEQMSDGAKLVQEEEEKERMYSEALDIYKGNVQEDLASEGWMVPIATWYQSIYLSAARELIQIYSHQKKFNRIQEICIKALKVDELDEDFHYWLMRSLMEQYKVDLALKHYNETTRLFQKHLGIRTSELLSQAYKEMISLKNVNTTLDGRNILEDLLESEKREGVYFCEFVIFKEIFRVESRRALRDNRKTVEYILLFTMNSRDYYNETENGKLYNIRLGMERLEGVLRNHLRTGDVVSRFSDNQFVVMLSACKEEHAVRVGSRIIETLFCNVSDKKVKLRCELLTEGNNVITIS